MYRKMVVIGLIASLAWAKTYIDPTIKARPVIRNVVEPSGNASIIPGNMSNKSVKSLFLMELTVDSAANQYGVWSQEQNPISVLGDTILFVERALSDSLSGSGFLLAAWSLDGGLTWTKARDINLVSGIFDQGARYPSALATPVGPVATFPELTGGSWGYMAAITGIYDDPSTWYGENGGNQQVHKNVSVYIPENQSAFCVGASAAGGLLYGIYDIANGFYSTAPTAVPDAYYLIGLDYAGGYVHILSMDANGALLDVKYDVANSTFSTDTVADGIPGVVLSSGDTLDGLSWCDAAVLSDGTPIFTIGMSVSDTTKPILKQYESRAIFVVRPDSMYLGYVDTTADGSGYVYYTQLSVDKSNDAILWGYEKMTTLLDTNYTDTISWGIYDVVGRISTDGGYTWSDEINFTNTPSVSEQLVQFARSFEYVDDTTMAVYFVYSMPRGTADPNYDLFYDVAAAGGATSIYYHVIRYGKPVDEIYEKKFANKGLSLGSNIVKNSIIINSTANLSDEVQIVNPAGRVVKDLTDGLRKGRNVIDVSDLENGIYFFRAGNHTSKFIIRK